MSCSHDGSWRFWDLETKTELLKQEGHSRGVYAMSLHPDGSLLFTGDLGGTGMVWDLRTGKPALPILGHVRQLLSSDFSPNGHTLATGSDDNTIRVFDLRRRNCQQIIPAHQKLVSSLQFQPNKARFLISSSYDHTCKVWSVQDWSLQKVIQLS